MSVVIFWNRIWCILTSDGSSPQHLERPHGEHGSSSLQRGSGVGAPSGVQGQSSWWGTGAKPPEAEALLFLGHSMEAANLLIFLKFGMQKSQIFVLSLQKNHGWPRNGGRLEQNWGPVPSRPGLKAATDCYFQIWDMLATVLVISLRIN